jgi:hypothetical protein
MKKIIQQIWVFIGRAGLVIILFLLVVYTSKRIHRTYILVRQSVSDWSGFVSVYDAQDYQSLLGPEKNVVLHAGANMHQSFTAKVKVIPL